MNPLSPPRARPLKLPLDAVASHSPEPGWKLPLVVAIVAGALAAVDPVRRALWVSLGMAALVALAYALVPRVSRARAGGSEGWLVIDDDAISRVQSARDGKRRTLLARWDAPFGVSVLANAARTRVILAFTTPLATRFLALRLETPRDADIARDLLETAVTVADVDLDLAAGHGEDVQLGAPAARTFLGELMRRDPFALRRLYLSDARGSAITVEPERLLIGDRTIDLSSPVDWRVFTFHEGEPLVAALYHATAIRQGAHDVVLVCRAGADAASWSGAAWGGGRTDAPPDRESRVAIDGLFMTPLRAVLAEAPRLSRPPPAREPSRGRGRNVEAKGE